MVALGFKRRLAAPKLQPKKPATVRRTSSVTNEDRQNAIKIRKIALKSNGRRYILLLLPDARFLFIIIF